MLEFDTTHYVVFEGKNIMPNQQTDSNLLCEPFNPFRLAEQQPLMEQYFNNLKRNEVRQIIISYHQRYDHFHEVLQNAVDACERAYRASVDGEQPTSPYEPHIKIKINVDSNKITVIDNGTGITLDDVHKYLFTPYATNKPDYPVRQRGEKGVGNTFLSYGSSAYHFTTRTIGGSGFIAGNLSEGICWTLSEDPTLVMPLVEPAEPHELLSELQNGTIIEITFSEQTNIRRLKDHGTTLQHWEAIIRLHTAAGYIDMQENDEFLNALKVTLYVTYQGITQSKILQTGYLYPHKVRETTSVRLRDLRRGERGRLPPRHTMKDCIFDIFDSESVKQKTLEKLESYSRFGPYRNELREDIVRLNPRAYVLFAWSSEFWSNLNERTFERESNEIHHGIVFSTKTQRLAEPKNIDFSFRTGDYNRFFILLDVDQLEADIGRKSLEKRVTNLANLIADTFHNTFVEFFDALKPAPRERREDEERELEDLLNAAITDGTAIDLPRAHLAVLKEPREEQDVVALFFNLMGTGYLKGYRFYSTKIARQYDGVGYFELNKNNDILYDVASNPLGIPEELFAGQSRKASTQRNFIEFKISTDDLIRDIKNGDKQLRDIKWLICWKKGNRHASEGISIDEILEENQRGHREFYGITDIMRDATGTSVYVIRLQKVIEILRRSQE